MSHKKLREDKTCLNCGNHVEERFCSHCGQENLQIQDSAFHLIIHYIQDLFHYDGMLWHTLRNLIVKPGQVAVEYMEGKRKRNLEPVRFYVLASTVFFFLLFYLLSGDSLQQKIEPKENYQKRFYQLEQEKKFIGQVPDTLHINFLLQSLREKIDSLNRDSTRKQIELDLLVPVDTNVTYNGWLDKWFNERADARRIEMKEKYEGDEAGATGEFLNEIYHKLPQLLFLSLPFFAFFLKLLYFRTNRRKYVQHFIFSIYHYAYLYVTMCIFLIVQYLIEKSGVEILDTIFGYVTAAFFIYLSIYLLLSMKRFYLDRWLFLIPRYFILLFLSSFTMIILFLLIIFLTYLF